MLAVRDRLKKRWIYAGHVGTGFDEAALKSLYGTMQRLRTDEKPFDQKVKDEKATTWLIPKLVGEVKFTEWTSEARCGIPPSWGCAPTKRRLRLSANKHEKDFDVRLRAAWRTVSMDGSRHDNHRSRRRNHSRSAGAILLSRKSHTVDPM